jgi:hypothetical protein
MAETDRHALSVDFEDRGIAIRGNQHGTLAALLTDRERLQRAPVDLHDGLAREQPDDIDVESARAARDEQSERNRSALHEPIHRPSQGSGNGHHHRTRASDRH